MRMKFTFKSLLLAAGLLVGSNAWANVGDENIVANISCTEDISDGILFGETNFMTIGTGGGETKIIENSYMRIGDHENVVSISENDRPGSRDVVEVHFDMAWGNANNMGNGISLKDANNEKIVYLQYAWWSNGTPNENNLGIDMGKDFEGVLGQKSNNPAWNNRTHFVITVDYAQKKVTTVASIGSTTKTYTAALSNTNPVATFTVFGYNAQKNDINRAGLFGNLIIKTIEGDYNVQTAKYTVKWMADSEVIKEDEREADVASKISLLPEDLSSFFVGDVKYIVTENDADGKTVSADGNTVVTVSVRKAEKWAYTVTSSVGDVPLKWSASGEVWEDEPNVSIVYPRYQANGNVLAEKGPIGNDLKQTITLNNADYTENFAYNATGVENLYLLSEAEDLNTNLPTSSPSLFPDRCSNRTIINGANGTLLSLPAGKYIFNLGVIGGDNNTHSVKYNVFAGEQQIITDGKCEGNFLAILSSKEFTLTEETEITFTCSDPSSDRGIDLVYVQKTGDAEIELVSSANLKGYKTFYNASVNYEVDENTTIYTAAVNEEKDAVVLTKVDGKVVPAGNAVLLQTTDEEKWTITLTQTAEEGEGDFEGNELVAATVAGENPEAYILAYATGKELAFYQYTGSLAVGDVYLPIVNSLGIKSIAIAGDDTATAIETVEAENAADGALYNVAGQQVGSDYKGIVIKNGKKYLNK